MASIWPQTSPILITYPVLSSHKVTAQTDDANLLNQILILKKSLKKPQKASKMVKKGPKRGLKMAKKKKSIFPLNVAKM